MDIRSVVAASRFGLGRRPDEPEPTDPLAWLEAQIAAPLPEGALGTATLDEVFAAIREDRMDPPGPGRPARVARLYRAGAAAFLAHCVGTEAPLRARLIAFWANHLTVSQRRSDVGGMAGHYHREAIAPHIAGRFADMLVAAVRHPAMLAYLDNFGSIGPDSVVGRRSGRGLNENLAREILELHTVTPAAGYAQADVTELARILTGWSVERMREPMGMVFRPGTHQPGPKTLMGRRYEQGEEAGIEALRWLAEHPATHRNLAAKLVRHFVADDPPPAAVERVFAALRDSRGDLGAATRAVLRLPAAWSPPLTKLRAPIDYIIAAFRAVGAPADPALAERMIGATVQLGQTIWGARAPDGWPDRAADWASPEGMMRRVEFAYTLAGREGARADAGAVAVAALGPLARAETLREAARAGSAREALTLVLTSPEFQRR